MACICLGMLLLLPTGAPAQDGGVPAAPIHVRVGKVTDTSEAKKHGYSPGGGGFGFGREMNHQQGCIQMHIEDPNQRIDRVSFLNVEGTQLWGAHPWMSDVSWTNGVFWTADLTYTPPPGTQMALELRVPAAVKIFPFTMEKIPLP
jgi:hypothetical protein